MQAGGSMVPVTGAVLTGGRSRRFGSPKALVRVDGVPMAVRVAQALAGAGCNPVVAVGVIEGLAEAWHTGVVGADSALGPILADQWPGEGPLGGVLSALAHCSGDLVTAPCDLPWLDELTVRSLLALVADQTNVGSSPPGDPVPFPGAVYGVNNGAMVPVIWWSQRSRPVLEAAFEAGERSLKGALGLLEVRVLEVSPEVARGVNTPEDLGACIDNPAGHRSDIPTAQSD